MHYLLSIFLLFSGFGLFAQKSNPDEHFSSSFDVFCGQKFFQNETLNGSVGSVRDINFGTPISFIGFSGTTILLWNRRYSYPETIGFYHILPQKVRLNDSIQGRISGFNIRMPLAGYDIFRYSENVDIVLGSGFNTGRIRLFGHSSLEQVNAYFAPFVSIAPRVKIGRLSLQFRAEYELDITRSRWRKVCFSNSPKVDLGPMKSTGLSTSVSVGWVLSNRRDSSKDNK